MSKKTEYNVKIPLFYDRASELWKDMPNIISGIVARKQDAINKFNELDSIVNGGILQQVGTAFGEPIYARVNTSDPDQAKYMSERLGKMMGAFMMSEPEEITLDGKRYTVVLKETL